jgi:hypothetical protein
VNKRREWRLPNPEVLEMQRSREPVEQSLAAAEDDRRDDDGQLVDDALYPEEQVRDLIERWPMPGAGTSWAPHADEADSP